MGVRLTQAGLVVAGIVSAIFGAMGVMMGAIIIVLGAAGTLASYAAIMLLSRVDALVYRRLGAGDLSGALSTSISLALLVLATQSTMLGLIGGPPWMYMITGLIVVGVVRVRVGGSLKSDAVPEPGDRLKPARPDLSGPRLLSFILGTGLAGTFFWLSADVTGGFGPGFNWPLGLTVMGLCMTLLLLLPSLAIGAIVWVVGLIRTWSSD